MEKFAFPKRGSEPVSRQLKTNNTARPVKAARRAGVSERDRTFSGTL
jgi:hypothetical protein